MSSWSATASSSSSQSSRLSWQPSQEANFHTARRGRVCRATLNFPLVEKRGDSIETKDWAFATDKGGPELTMPANPNRAFHVAFHREKDAVCDQPALAQRIDGKPHHDLRSAHHCHRVIRIDWRASDQRRHDANITPPIRRGVIDRDCDVDIEAPSPCFEFPPIEDVGRSPRAIEHDDLAVTLAVSEHVINYWAQRSQTEAACHDDDVAALAIENGPG